MLLPFNSHAQFDEIGTIFGCSNYSGDLTERDFEPLESNFAYGFFVRRNLSRQFSLKLQFSKLVLSGKDGNNTAEGGLWKRNLNFRSDLFEFGAQAEWVPISLKSGENQFMPYLFTGLAAFYFNPQTEMNGNIYNLQHYQTEGVDYNQFQIAIPFGAGLRFNIRNRGNLGFEFGLRKTFTDYLDDVSNSYRSDLRELGELNAIAARLSYRGIESHASDTPRYPKPGTQRGNPDKKDWYALFGMTLGINISR
ncbi:MAG: DUF6089 family protein [Bacteroidales bacterium]|nr:DUF6089 family protein [Bacteroidales bacterium]